MSDIKCTVKNCVYNSSEACNANAIEVNGTNDSTTASTSDFTLCQTFKPE